MSSIFWLCVLTGAGFAWLAYRGTHNLLRAALTGFLAFGLVLITPGIILAFAAHLGGVDWRNEGLGDSLSVAVVLGNVVAWAWAGWNLRSR